MSSNNSSRTPNLSLQTKFSCNEQSCDYYSENANSPCGGQDCRTEAAAWSAWAITQKASNANLSSQNINGTIEPPPTPAQGGK